MKKPLFISFISLHTFATAENFYRQELFNILTDQNVQASLMDAYRSTLQNNYEYCGWIYKKSNSTYSVKYYTTRQQTSCAISQKEHDEILSKNPGSQILIHFHTHPKSEFGNIKPSLADMDLVLKNQLEVDDEFKTSALIITQSPIKATTDELSSGVIAARDYAKGKLTFDIIKTNTIIDGQNMSYFFLSNKKWSSSTTNDYYSQSIVNISD